MRRSDGTDRYRPAGHGPRASVGARLARVAADAPGHPGAAGRGLRRPHRLASDRPPGPARLPRAAGPAYRRLTSSLGVNAMTVHASWREAAACRDADPELFFPVGTAGPALRQIQEAKRICLACPAQAPCLAWV